MPGATLSGNTPRGETGIEGGLVDNVDAGRTVKGGVRDGGLVVGAPVGSADVSGGDAVNLNFKALALSVRVVRRIEVPQVAHAGVSRDDG